MARLTGTAGQVTSVTERWGVTSWSVDYTGGAVNTTGMDSLGVSTFLPSTTEWSGTCEGHYDSTATRDPLDPADTRLAGPIAVDLRQAAAGVGCAGNAIITGCIYSVSYDGSLDYSMTFQGTGALTIP